MKAILLIGIGGGIGSMLRYASTLLFSKLWSSTFPFATLIVNILGCLLIGFLIGFLDRQLTFSADLKFLLITGFCGGFTTFSAFASENLTLIQNGNLLYALIYTSLSVLVGILFVIIGLYLSNQFLGSN